jgi:gliding motility-associated-like protein
LWENKRNKAGMEKSKTIKRISLSGKGIPLFLAMVLFSFSEMHAQSPATPALDSISITSDNYPIISWFPNSDATIGYVIVRRDLENGYYLWNKIDTLLGIQQSSYIDNSLSACAESRWYRIYAFAGPNIPDSPWSDTLKTILLENPVLDVCANTITFEWSKYINMTTELGGYKIMLSEDGGEFTELKQVSPSQLSYIHYDPKPNVLYSYKIRAVNEDGTRTSTSCEKSIATRTYNKPTFAYIRYANVENNDHIKLEWLTDDAPISKFEIHRSDNGFNYSVIHTFEDLINFKPATAYIDQEADFNSQSYQYMIKVFDSCGNYIFDSQNIAKTIFLTGKPGFVGFLNELEWNGYEDWNLGIKNYHVYRKINETPDPSGFLAELSGTETTYNDDVTGQGNTEGSFTYWVEASENEGNNGYEDIPDVSISNEVTISQETRILIPNAFMPGGTPPDDVFKPIVSFIEQDLYEMVIFNKWGQQLFVSNEITNGWDGKYKGEYVPSGTYVYLIKFQNAQGQPDEKRGTLTVVR